jgi:hypothetical protein
MQVEPPGHVAVTVMLVLAMEIQLARRRPVEHSVEMPRL